MQATFTLSTTTWSAPIAALDTVVNVASTSGLVPGLFLFANREALKVQYLTGINNQVKVLRGQLGTETRAHGTAETVYIAPGYQLFEMDPTGLPVLAPLVNPHINVINGNVWVVQGDDVGPGTDARSWQLQTTTQAPGALGVRVTTTTTPT